ncbi:PREDICTED: protein jim lovell [Nicrophorus vespilloides]|uniref:Protein jim lovell n=1 Tax=Nicrophorus vespilloides TaxID=110193 RepID=A0ABM1ME11_NICVS|nr:PREDICTED: protein jim lovell [Nicrophorus vespilloides]
MSQSHYSLRWNNHQSHILSAFESLLQAETLVDVTLVCAETSVRAHKVVLSACSPFFQRIFSENPCKHPVIVLKDFSGWEVQAIVDFMYKGEISVIQDQLQSLIKAAESLQVRGLANQDQFGIVDKESSPITNQTPTPSTSPNDFDRGFFPNLHRFTAPGITMRTPNAAERSPPFSPVPAVSGYDLPPPAKLPHMTINFPEALVTRAESPQPRRKQARPRRRSGELTAGAQDLTTTSAHPSQNQHHHHHNNNNLITSSNIVSPTTTILKPQLQPVQPHEIEETAENLCMKKQPSSKEDRKKDDDRIKMLTPDPSASPELDLSMHHHKDFAPSPPLHLPAVLNLKHELDNHSPLPFPPMPSVSALAMTPPHSKFFGLDSPLLFPPGMDGCRNPLLDMTDPRSLPDPQIFTKKKMGRPKGQHSAPRGGPPRSWTNGELTEALQHVWNKKMTTSQASRIFGIPYNSLLMYVRGKYGKSLKLEQLRKDCIAGPGMDLMNIGGSGSAGNNNNNKISDRDDGTGTQPNTRPPSTEEPPQPPIFNPFGPNFYPDFGTGFPIPVSMIHLLPQSEKNRDSYGPPPMDEDIGKNDGRVKDEPQDMFLPLDRRELVHQNGQD